jgi:hypothetical protein
VIDGAKIVGVTAIGEVTVALLRFNDDERLLERLLLRQAAN